MNFFHFIILLCYSLISFVGYGEIPLPENYDAGDGSEANPYQIRTLTQLRNLSETPLDWTKYFILTSHINASDTQTWNIADHDNDLATPDEAMGFSPIGNSEIGFSGGFDGDGFTISNLVINRLFSTFVGLFGSVSNSIITDVGVVDGTFSGNTYAGGLIGKSSSSSISKSYTTGTILVSSIASITRSVNQASPPAVGGLIGFSNSKSTIINCFSNIAVTVSSSLFTVNAGGLIGENYNGSTVQNCYASGEVTADSVVSVSAGGLIGNNASVSSVTNVYATGPVTTNTANSVSVGGLVGYNGSVCPVSNCYATGQITVPVSVRFYVGGLIGQNSSTVTNGFWDKNSTGYTVSSGSDSVDGFSSSELLSKDFSTIYPFGFTDTNPWQDMDATTFPRFHWETLMIYEITDKTINEETILSFSTEVTWPFRRVGLAFSLVNAPSYATIDSATGKFSWRPFESQDGLHHFSVVVTAGEISHSELISVTVNDVNGAPILNSIGNNSVAEESEITFEINGHDPDIPVNLLTFAATTLPEGATFDPLTRNFCWTPTELQDGLHILTFTVSDGELSDSEEIRITVNEVNNVPLVVLATQHISMGLNSEGIYRFRTVSVSDIDFIDLVADEITAIFTVNIGQGEFEINTVNTGSVCAIRGTSIEVSSVLESLRFVTTALNPQLVEISVSVTDALGTGVNGIIKLNLEDKLIGDSALDSSTGSFAQLSDELTYLGVSPTLSENLKIYQDYINIHKYYVTDVVALQEIVEAVNAGEDIIFYELAEGWNTVHIPSDGIMNVTDSFTDISGLAWCWNGTDAVYQQIEGLHYGIGSWVYWNTSFKRVSVTGAFVEPNYPEVLLEIGWNLVGTQNSASFSSERIMGIWQWDSHDKNYLEVADISKIEINKAYWVFFL